MKAPAVRLSVSLLVLLLVVTLVGPAGAQPSDQDAGRPFVVTYMEVDPPTPKQYQDVRFRVYYDLVGPLADYNVKFNGEVLLRDSQNQIVERFAIDRTNASLLPDAEALKKNPNFRKWVLTTYRFSFKKWSDSATVEVWLRPQGYGGGTDYPRAALRINIAPDPDAVTRCASFLSKKMAMVAPSNLSWFLVGAGASTRLGTCSSRSCVAWEIAQLIGRTTGQVTRTILTALNVNNLAGAEDCTRLAF